MSWLSDRLAEHSTQTALATLGSLALAHYGAGLASTVAGFAAMLFPLLQTVLSEHGQTSAAAVVSDAQAIVSDATQEPTLK